MSEEEIKLKIWEWVHNYFIIQHPSIGYILFLIIVIGILIRFLINWLPRLEILNSKVIKPIASKTNFKRLIKNAIKSDIQGNVNLVVRDLIKELPQGWLKEMKIVWMAEENKEKFLDDGDMVIRMRPLENQDENFLTAIYYYFKKYCFPQTKRVIPDIILDASVLYLCKRIINLNKKDLVPIFNEYILEPQIERRDKILDYMYRYEEIDRGGFFTGPFIREVHEVANLVRFTPERKKINNEIIEILKYIEGFLKSYKNQKGIQPNEWNRIGPVTSFGFILVARPWKAKINIASKFYVKRANERLNQGISRLYILGTSKEKSFANKVIDLIDRDTDYKLIEKFEPYFDYRGQKGGIAALFIAKNIQTPI